MYDSIYISNNFLISIHSVNNSPRQCKNPECETTWSEDEAKQFKQSEAKDGQKHRHRMAELYLDKYAVLAHVYDMYCDKCNDYTYYDGVEDHYFRPHTHQTGPLKLIVHSLFDMFRVASYKAAFAFHAFHAMIQCIYQTGNYNQPESLKKFISKSTFIKYYNQYQAILAKELELKCSECARLNQLPQVVTSDGTELLQSSSNVQNCISPCETQYKHDQKMIRMQKKWRATRKVYIREKKLRKRVINHFVTSRLAVQATDKLANNNDKPLTQSQLAKLYKDLTDHLRSNHYVDALKWLQDQQNTSIMKCSKHTNRMWNYISHWIRFIANQNAPLFTVIKYDMIQPLLDWNWDDDNGMPNKDEFKRMKDDFKQDMPWLWRAINCMMQTAQTQPDEFDFPESVFKLIKELANLSKECLDELINHRREQPSAPRGKFVHEIYSCPEKTGTCYGSYCNREIETMRPKYDYDSEKKKRKKRKDLDKEIEDIKNGVDDLAMDEKDGDEEMKDATNNDNEEAGDDVDELTMTSTCNKEFNDYEKMSGGIIVASCVEHSQCIGFNIIKGSESVDDHFSLLMALYPGLESPSHYIMDNVCNFYPYIMAREPEKFKSLRAFTDSFHGYVGHKCGPVQSVKTSKDVDPLLLGANDSIIEQINAILQRLHICAMWMNLKSFSRHVQITLDMFNRRAKRKKLGLPLWY